MKFWKKLLYPVTVSITALLLSGFGSVQGAYVNNPMTTTLDAGNYNIGSVGTLTAAEIIAKGPEVNVKAFGAVGDGVTNDTTSIQNALNSLPAAGGKVLLPPGIYKVTSTLTVPSHATLSGTAIDASVIKWGGSSLVDVIKVEGTDAGANAARRVIIERLTIDGNNLSGEGIYFHYVNECMVRQVYIVNVNNSADGIKIEQGTEVTVQDSKISSAGVHAIEAFDNASSIRILSNRINACETGFGIYWYGPGSHEMLVQGNAIESNGLNVTTGGGIKMGPGAQGLSVIGNYWENNHGREILLAGTDTDYLSGVTIVGNGMVGNSTLTDVAIDVNYTRPFLIMNNTFSQHRVKDINVTGDSEGSYIASNSGTAPTFLSGTVDFLLHGHDLQVNNNVKLATSGAGMTNTVGRLDLEAAAGSYVQANSYLNMNGGNTGTVTLATGTTQTTIYNAHVTSYSRIVLTPKTQSAGSLQRTSDVYIPWRYPGDRFVIRHGTAAGTETFDYVIVN